MAAFAPSLRQAIAPPSAARPIVIVGAGGIVRDAHIPTYQKLGFPIAGLFDTHAEAAVRAASQFGIERVYETLTEALNEPGAVFDLAVPATAVLGLVSQIPEHSGVLIQKPLGPDLPTAKAIVATCQQRQLRAAVNFQLRFSPNMLALEDALQQNLLGEVADLEVRINVHTPWQLWSFLKGLERHELLYHSIHYLDTIRHLLGEPKAVVCRALPHPLLSDYGDTRSSILLDYGPRIRASLVMNHAHDFGTKHAASMFKLEGTLGAAVARMGVNLDYPHGMPDTLEIAQRCDKQWHDVPLRGSWFIEAFEGPMSNLQCVVSGESEHLVSPVGDALKTMAVVEACYESNRTPLTPVPAV